MNNQRVVVRFNAEESISKRFNTNNYSKIYFHPPRDQHPKGATDNKEDQIYQESTRRGSGGCDSLCSNDQAIKERLKFIGDQLVQFIKLEDCRPIKSNDNNHEHLKLKTIWSIYLKLLRAGPLDLYWNYKQATYYSVNNNGSINNTCAVNLDKRKDFKLNHARQQVLFMIEGLSGYCDSINKLRLILKSPTMISVVSAYEDIVEEIENLRFHMQSKQRLGENSGELTTDLTLREWAV